MSKKDGAEVWEERGRQSYRYKGEEFYTITPVPNYCSRRRYIIRLLKPFVFSPTCKFICDFGCGDGYYINQFSALREGIQWYGIDISSTMLERTRKLCPEAMLLQRSAVEDVEIKFQLIYAIAVFAHVLNDSDISKIWASIYNNLDDGGQFLIVEQIAPHRYAGQTFVRRTSEQYKAISRQAGFQTIYSKVITFPAHQLFERRIAPLWYNYVSRGATDIERRIAANRLFLFRALSRVFTSLTLSPVRADSGALWGYGVMGFRKERTPQVL